ncbi:MAG: hypothetical protein AAFW46_15990 [Pseudomonadota bacterium]
MTRAPLKRLGVTTSGLRQAKRIHRILELAGWRVRPLSRFTPFRRVDAVAGWGGKPTAIEARRVAAARGAPFVTLEDGFIRSEGLGVAGDPPLSLILDQRGVYTDFRSRDSLEAMLLEGVSATPELVQRAEAALAALRRGRVSKYNHAPDARPGLLPDRFVLAIDQTVGDAAIAGAAATEASFERMLRAALAEAAGATVLVKTHPDVLAGVRQGYLDPPAVEALGGRVLGEDVNPWDLFERAERVYAVSSQMGYEAVLAGCEAHVFAWPFYAGWGVTVDRAPPPSTAPPRAARSALELFAASHLLYPLYYDPQRDALATCESIVERLSRPRAVGRV